MSKSAIIHARIEPNVKEKAEEILSTLGLSMTGAMNLFLNQLILKKGLPFSVSIPNETTVEAIKEGRKSVKSKVGFDSPDELFASLDSED